MLFLKWSLTMRLITYPSYFFSKRLTPARSVTCAGVRRSLYRAIAPVPLILLWHNVQASVTTSTCQPPAYPPQMPDQGPHPLLGRLGDSRNRICDHFVFAIMHANYIRRVDMRHAIYVVMLLAFALVGCGEDEYDSSCNR